MVLLVVQGVSLLVAVVVLATATGGRFGYDAAPGVPLPIHWRARVVSTIRHLFISRSRISERIVGEPLEIGARKLRPVVRVSGWRDTRGDAPDSRAGVQLRGELAGVIVLERDGREHRLPTPDNTRLILWRLAGIALMVAVASQVVVRVLR